jgi:tRNA uridine 5-carbamoylmethylation protein Kti12
LRLQKISAQKDNLQNDLIVTKNALDRNQAENQELAKALKDRKEAHNNQIERMCHEHSSERRMVENSRDSAVEKSKELEGELNRVRREKEKILRDFEHLNEVLKSKVGLMIQETVIGHMRKVEGE